MWSAVVGMHIVHTTIAVSIGNYETTAVVEMLDCPRCTPCVAHFFLVQGIYLR